MLLAEGAGTAMGMKASEVGDWLRQRVAPKECWQARPPGSPVGRPHLVLRPGPSFDQLFGLLGTSARARLDASASLSHEIPDRNSHCQKNEDDPPPVCGIGPAAWGRSR